MMLPFVSRQRYDCDLSAERRIAESNATALQDALATISAMKAMEVQSATALVRAIGLRGQLARDKDNDRLTVRYEVSRYQLEACGYGSPWQEIAMGLAHLLRRAYADIKGRDNVDFLADGNGKGVTP
jgi:hypothetical protein